MVYSKREWQWHWSMCKSKNRMCKCMQERFTAVFLSFSLGSHPYFCTKWWKSSVLPYLAAHWRQLRRPPCMHKQVIWWSTRATHSAGNALNHPILHNSGYNMTQACTTCTHNVPRTIPTSNLCTYVKTFTIQSCRLPSGMQTAQRAYATYYTKCSTATHFTYAMLQCMWDMAVR